MLIKVKYLITTDDGHDEDDRMTNSYVNNLTDALCIEGRNIFQ